MHLGLICFTSPWLWIVFLIYSVVFANNLTLFLNSSNLKWLQFQGVYGEKLQNYEVNISFQIYINWKSHFMDEM